ncbi:Fe(3+) ABC transporter substrate-binding protein [Candidatus Kapabacteria bacterium]|nr:Fe(3+) ABC transporter substrate-binding protein [Candidatus Kapabacteria bacterium]
MKKYFIIIVTLILAFSCNKEKQEVIKEEKSNEVNVYSHRHYDIDKEIFADFEKETGIKINLLKSDAKQLITKIQQEAENTPADILITVDAGNLWSAKKAGITESVSSQVLNDAIPANLRDPEGHWYGLTKRGRIVVYSKERVNKEELSTYEDLTDPKWKGKLLVRSSSNMYNQSLLASIIANHNSEVATKWAADLVANFAREPKGNDRDQVKAIAAGEGDIAIINTYYMGKLLNSDNPQEVEAGKSVGVFFPNQDDRGSHINISGAAFIKNSPNRANAIKLVEYLTTKKVQSKYAKGNHEYPINKDAEVSELLKSFGEFKEDTLSLENLGKNNKEAVMIFDRVSWK